MSTSRLRTSNSHSLMDRNQPDLLPDGSEVSIYIRRPQTGRQYMFFLRNAAEYAYYLFDSKIPYFGTHYDLHALFDDIVEEYFYGQNFSGRGFDEQLEILIDEFAVGGFIDPTQLSELRFRLMGLRNDIRNILKLTLPRVADFWHINYKMDSSFTVWAVIE